MNSTTIAALAALAGAVIALAVYHLAVVRPALSRLQTASGAHDALLGSSGGGGLVRLSSLEEAAKRAALADERFEQRLGELERLSRVDLSRVGFVRFNAFADTGSELSFALALLSRDGDGVVMSSLYSREDTRTYGKAVKGFRSLQDASKEELRAIALAKGEEA